MNASNRAWATASFPTKTNLATNLSNYPTKTNQATNLTNLTGYVQTYFDLKTNVNTKIGTVNTTIINMNTSIYSLFNNYFTTTQINTLHSAINTTITNMNASNRAYTNTQIGLIDIADLNWQADWMIAYSNNEGLVELDFHDQANKYLRSNGEGALTFETPTDTNTFNSSTDMRREAGVLITTINATIALKDTIANVNTKDATINTTITNKNTTDYKVFLQNNTANSYTINSNITTNGLIFSRDTANHKIYDNSTCVIIKGDTSTLEIC